MAGNLRDNRNEIIRIVNTVWETAPAIVGVTGPYPRLVIAAADGDGNPDDNNNKKPWARLRVQHTGSKGTSVSGRLYKHEGTLTLNLFIFRDRTNAWAKVELLGEAFAKAIRAANGKGNVYFKGVTVRERPINNGFNQVDVVAGFWWTQLGD